MRMPIASWLATLVVACVLPAAPGAEPDRIVHHGKIVTVDRAFSIQEAMAIQDGRVVRVGSNEEVLAAKGPKTEVVDLGGRMVLPGLIDSHMHPFSACMTEFDHAIPEMETIEDVLDYVRARAAVLQEGEWVTVRQVFITRLREQRYPTREELDRAAPKHPVIFATGPDAALNSLGLKQSGIDKNFTVDDGGPGYVEKDQQTGDPTGILRSCTRYVKVKSSGKGATDQDRLERILELFKDYNAVGLTTIGDRDADASEVDLYRRLAGRDDLTVRVSISHGVDTGGSVEEVKKRIRRVAEDSLFKRTGSTERGPSDGGPPVSHGGLTTEGGPMVRIIGIKTYLDGGMLTGSAYMREPWGVSKIYGIRDPAYRGLLFIPPERLRPIVEETLDLGLQFTAHSVGDGAVHALLDAYEAINRTKPIRERRPSISHSNFMSREAVAKCADLGVVVDIQPAWLYLDTRTLVAQFGYERMRYFQPLRSLFAAGAIAGGGSDHMQRIGSLRSINPYNPFLGMWITLARQAKGYDGVLHPEEALTREQAIRFYTINNAYILFRDNEVGSLEPGKLADFLVVDTDLLTCPLEAVRRTQVLQTYVGGRRVYQR